jgi:hypothetical protein
MADETPTDPWYRGGLRFTCTQCGTCCTGEPGFVWVGDDDLAALAAFLGESVELVKAVYTRKARGKRTLREKDGGDCVFFETGKGCTVYPARPPQCRTWPFWESNVETPEAWAHTTRICPGSGEGELIPVEEITRRVRVIRL